MEVSDERWMTRGLFRLAFPLVSLWSSSSLTSMAGKSKQSDSVKQHMAGTDNQKDLSWQYTSVNVSTGIQSLSHTPRFFVCFFKWKKHRQSHKKLLQSEQLLFSVTHRYGRTSYTNTHQAGWYLYFPCHLQLVCSGCKAVSCAVAAGSARGEPAGWVGLRRRSLGEAAGLAPAGRWSREKTWGHSEVRSGLGTAGVMCGALTLGGLLLTGLSTWVMGWRMLKGTNPTWLK